MTGFGECRPYQIELGEKIELDRVAKSCWAGATVIVRASQPVMDDRYPQTPP